jgi:hypothetical protein
LGKLSVPRRSAGSAGFAANLVLDVFLQGNCVVMLRVVGTIEQRNGTLPCGIAYRSPIVWCVVKFGKVLAAEFLPFSGS